MTTTIDSNRLRRSPPAELVHYLRLLMNELTEATVSAHLFDLMEHEAIAPRVMSIWLTISKSPKTILKALKQESSASLRCAAIKYVGKSLRKGRWESWDKLWDGLGGTTRILDLLAALPVVHVKLFVKLVSRCNRWPASQSIGKAISELLQGLLPLRFPTVTPKTSDERPFTNSEGLSLYASLLPSCNSTFVDGILQTSDDLLVKGRATTGRVLLRSPYDLYRTFDRQNFDRIDILEEPTEVSLPSEGLVQVPGYSEAMMLSLDILQQLAKCENVTTKPRTSVVHNIIQPLLRKARKRCRLLGWQQLEDIMNLSVQFLNTHPEEAKFLTFQHQTLCYYAVLLWVNSISRRNVPCPTFIALLAMMPYSNQEFLQNIPTAISWVRRSLRYPLLKLIFVHHGQKGLNIDINNDLKRMDVGQWPQSIFLSLECKEALGLAQRLLRVNGDEFLQPRSNTHSIMESDGAYGDVTVLLGLLGDPDGAIAAVEFHKKAAARSRDQAQRASCAESALRSSIATGSLRTYGDTLQWATRYVKDPLTAKTIFGRAVVGTTESVALLSAIPLLNHNPEGLGVATIAANIIEANKILLAIIEIAISALKEPSFYRPDWLVALSLPSEIVTERIKRARYFGSHFLVFSEDIYESIWKDMLSVALRLERLSLQPGLEKLFVLNPKGVLSLPSEAGSESANLPYLRFVDNLARGRNAIWEKYRLSNKPATSTLPQALPRGLAIQHLLGHVEALSDLTDETTPFLFSRVNETLFPDPSHALAKITDDEEIQSAIGSFVNSYNFALQAYIQCSDEEVREERELRAWNYALGKLSSVDRLDDKEAYRFWEEIFDQAGVQIYVPSIDLKTSMEYPLLPSGESPIETMEWNPEDDFHPSPPTAIKSRPLESTYLDLSISQRRCYSWDPFAFQVDQLQTKAVTSPTFRVWNWTRISPREKVSPAIQDGMTVSALLYIDSKIKGGRTILIAPFPSPSKLRYPSLYLADEFLQRQDLLEKEALELLGRKPYVDNAPPTLLFNLARSAMDRLSGEAPSSTEYANMEYLAMKLISLITQSDRPQLAIGLVLEAIIEKPQASSWHCQLVRKSFWERLSARQAKDLIRTFSKTIQERMKAQVAARKSAAISVGDGATAKPATSQPFVKITTVKMLAQLLGGSNFISESFAIEILADLLYNSSHIDIRAAVLGSLISKLYGPRSDSNKQKIISALEMIIPIAASLDERFPMLEKEWQIAENTKVLPTIGTGTPIASAILGTAMEHNWFLSQSPTSLRSEIASRLLIPIIERSIISNTRWLKVFAAKHGIDLDALGVPMLPVHPELLADKIRDSEWRELPASLVTLYHEFIMTNLSPAKKLYDFLDKDAAVRKLPETQHWLSLYGRTSPMFTHKHSDPILFSNRLAQALCLWNPTEEHTNGIKLSQLEDYVFLEAQTYLLEYPESHHFSELMDALKPSLRPVCSERSPAPNGIGSDLIERILAYINSLRRPEWQKNPSRTPSVLPHTLKYRLWLLPYPPPLLNTNSRLQAIFPTKGRGQGGRGGPGYGVVKHQELQRHNEADTTHSQCQEAVRLFALAFKEQIADICLNSKVYHDDLPVLRNAALELQRYYYAALACELGRLKDILETQDFLAIEIAQMLFEKAECPRDVKTVAESKEVIDSWRRSEIESVRMRGKALERRGAFADGEWVKMLFGDT